MALPDPVSITISGTASALARTGSGINSGAFMSADGLMKLSVSHQKSGKKTRSLIRLDKTKAVTDPVIPAQNIIVKNSPYLVIEHGDVGLTNAEIIADVVGFLNMLTASTNAILTKVVQTEA